MAPETSPQNPSASAPLTLQVNRPPAGAQSMVEVIVGTTHLLLNFSAADASPERQGDDLVFSFEDGGSVALTGFYTAVTKDTLPDFLVDQTTIPGAEFFAALGEGLMPAAGPQAAENAGRFQNWDTNALLQGIDALDGLEPGSVTPTVVVSALFPAAGAVLAGADAAAAAAVDAAPGVPVIPGAPDEATSSVTLHNEYRQGAASLQNSYGYYIKDANGNPANNELFIIWENVGNSAGQSFTIEGYTPDQLGFFLVPNGDSINSGKNNSFTGGSSTAEKGYTLYDEDGNPVSMDMKVLFDNAALNPDGQFNFADLNGKYQFWEDQKFGTSDWNLGDFQVRVEYDGWAEQADSAGSPFNKTFTREDGGQIIFGGVSSANHDILQGSEHDDTLVGHYGNDKLYGGDGNDMLYGGNGNDVLVGGAGNDMLLGGQGNDILIGGAGSNVLGGEKGEDIFVWLETSLDGGKDTVLDFNAQEDKLYFGDIDLDNIKFNEASSEMTITGTDGSSKVIHFEGNHGLTADTWQDAIASENEAVAEAVRQINADMMA